MQQLDNAEQSVRSSVEVERNEDLVDSAFADTPTPSSRHSMIVNPDPTSSHPSLSTPDEMDVVENPVDTLDTFEVDPEDKEFLREIIESGVAPAEDVKLFQEVQKLEIPEPRATEMDSDARTMVEQFSRVHLINLKLQGGAEQMSQYAMDVYQYARAVGPRFGTVWAREKVIHNEAVFREYLWSTLDATRHERLEQDGVYTAFYKADPIEGGDLIATLLLNDEGFWKAIVDLQGKYSGLKPGQKRKRSISVAPFSVEPELVRKPENSRKRRRREKKNALEATETPATTLEAVQPQPKNTQPTPVASTAGPPTTKPMTSQKHKRKDQKKVKNQSAKEQPSASQAAQLTQTARNSNSGDGEAHSSAQQDVTSSTATSSKLLDISKQKNGPKSSSYFTATGNGAISANEKQKLSQAERKTAETGKDQNQMAPVDGSKKKARKRNKNNNKLANGPPQLQTASEYYPSAPGDPVASEPITSKTIAPQSNGRSNSKGNGQVNSGSDVGSKAPAVAKPKNKRVRSRRLKGDEKDEKSDSVSKVDMPSTTEPETASLQEVVKATPPQKKSAMELVAETLAAEKAAKLKTPKKSAMEIVADSLKANKAAQENTTILPVTTTPTTISTGNMEDSQSVPDDPEGPKHSKGGRRNRGRSALKKQPKDGVSESKVFEASAVDPVIMAMETEHTTVSGPEKRTAVEAHGVPTDSTSRVPRLIENVSSIKNTQISVPEASISRTELKDGTSKSTDNSQRDTPKDEGSNAMDIAEEPLKVNHS
ncbi:hypothetical protein PVAG01_10923 [Phlyctema vagabunda]|uniref:Uncharacterized protein n=1 Tax=Phlyctema vagabunda TaxID=108571 RepID=A0ABR4P3N2_9HELO